MDPGVLEPIRFIRECNECGADHYYCDLCRSALCDHILQLVAAMLV